MQIRGDIIDACAGAAVLFVCDSALGYRRQRTRHSRAGIRDTEEKGQPIGLRDRGTLLIHVLGFTYLCVMSEYICSGMQIIRDAFHACVWAAVLFCVRVL
jgi:hypothetical protein